ncbi:MAG TPA: nitroreductase family protein [Ktedonobacterales bacterium]|jgi:nitroreductase|nr:nitroreductase family protein [Ktedonobacterales bacterium]
MVLDLTLDELLSTTRSVRKRLDFTRPVEPDVVHECLALAIQAPNGGNGQRWRWMVVTDPMKRLALGDCYRRGNDLYRPPATILPASPEESPPRDLEIAREQRREASSDYLAEHIHEAPVMVIPCYLARPEGKPLSRQAILWGSILPAAWSFMLALRSRGLGTAWTTAHLEFEREAAEILGIPYERVTQVVLFPVAHTIGTDFKPGHREPLESVVRWNVWKD